MQLSNAVVSLFPPPDISLSFNLFFLKKKNLIFFLQRSKSVKKKNKKKCNQDQYIYIYSNGDTVCEDCVDKNYEGKPPAFTSFSFIKFNNSREVLWQMLFVKFYGTGRHFCVMRLPLTSQLGF